MSENGYILMRVDPFIWHNDQLNYPEKLLLNKEDFDEKILLENKIKKLLVDILLGFFAGSKWQGIYESHGTIVMKKNGDCVGFHIIELENLKNYLFENIKLDTPSTSRHRFGNL